MDGNTGSGFLSKHLPVFLLGTENVMGGGVDGNTGSGLW